MTISLYFIEIIFLYFTASERKIESQIIRTSLGVNNLIILSLLLCNLFIFLSILPFFSFCRLIYLCISGPENQMDSIPNLVLERSVIFLRWSTSYFYSVNSSTLVPGGDEKLLLSVPSKYE